MASNALQPESAQAKRLTLHGVGQKLEHIEIGFDEIAAVAYSLSRDRDLDPETQTALSAIGRMAATWGCELVELREQVYLASDAERAGNVADFQARG